MAVGFRAAGTYVESSVGTPAIPYPAGLAAGDLLILQYSIWHTMTPTTPSGWTKLFGPVSLLNTSPATDGYLFYKIASGSESGTLTMAKTGPNDRAGGIMCAYTGVDTTTPVDVSTTANNASSGTTGTNPSVTTTKANTRLLHMYWNYSVSGTITPNASDTERYDSYGTGQSVIFELADKAQAATGSTGTSTVTFSTSTAGGMVASIAVAPVTATTYNGSATVSLVATVTTAGTATTPASVIHGAATVSETVMIATAGIRTLPQLTLTPRPPDSLTLTSAAAGSLVLVPRPPDSLVLTPR